MSSKKLQFKQTVETRTNKLLNDLSGMSDISFDTLAVASGNYTDIQMMTPEETVLQSLKNLMNLPVGGNVLFPIRGERVADMLFSPALSEQEAQTYIISYLNSNEPRINIHSVTSSKHVDDFNEQIVTLNVNYSFKNSSEIHNVIVDLQMSSDIAQS